MKISTNGLSTPLEKANQVENSSVTSLFRPSLLVKTRARTSSKRAPLISFRPLADSQEPTEEIVYGKSSVHLATTVSSARVDTSSTHPHAAISYATTNLKLWTWLLVLSKCYLCLLI